MSASIPAPHPSSAEYVLPTRDGMLVAPPPSEAELRIMAAVDARAKDDDAGGAV